MSGHVFTPKLIRASAGTGKTYALSSRFIELLTGGEQPGRILATTFTRKAAGEIQDRVLQRLADAVDAGEPDAKGVLGRLVSQLHRLNICTLDSFFIRAAGSFSLDLGLPPAWRIVDPVTDERLAAEAVDAMLEDDGPQRIIDLIRLLNPGELRRSVHEQIMGVVRDLHTTYRRQPDERAWCWQQAGPKLAVEDLRAALDVLVEIDVPRTRKGEPNKNWLKAKQKAIAAANAQDWEAFVGAGIASKIIAGEEMFSRCEIDAEMHETFEPLIIHACAALTEFHARRTRAMYELLRAFDHHYDTLKRAAGAMRFDDVTEKLAAAAGDIELRNLFYRLDGRLAHLLLDEFQDTSYPQWRVLEPIAAEILDIAGQDRSFFCVGDVKQAIYGWRGGMAEIFDTLEVRWPQLDVDTMDMTRRCRPAIVDTVNDVFESLASNLAARDFADAARQWGDRFNEHTSLHEQPAGHVRCEVGPEDADKPAMLNFAADRIAELVEQYPGRSIGVLVRTNKAVARLIYELRQPPRGVNASEEGGNPVTDSKAVSVILSLLHMADHPGDTAARYHVQRSPLGVIVGLRDFESDANAERVARDVRARLMHEGYGAALDHWTRRLAPACSPRDRLRLGQLVELAHQYEADATVRPTDFIRFVEAQHVADASAAADVRVMTVHQAKGLQFDIVVLPELDTKLGLSSQTPLVELRDPTDPLRPPIHISRYPNETMRALSEQLELMHMQTAGQTMRGNLCVLYVAMTRARYALHMLIQPDARIGDKLPARLDGLLRGALAPEKSADPDAILYEHGDPDWHDHVESEPAAARDQTPVTLEPKLAKSDRRRMLSRRSPSQLEGGPRIDLARLLTLDAGGGRQYGTTLHEQLAAIHWLDDTPLDDDLQRVLEPEPIAAALRRDRYPADADVSVHCEQPFAVRLDDELLTGYIDRLVLTREGDRITAAEVIDYKTDRTDDVDALAEHYRPQLEAYRRAVARMYGLDDAAITTRLLFLSPGQAVDVG